MSFFKNHLVVFAGLGHYLFNKFLNLNLHVVIYIIMIESTTSVPMAVYFSHF